MLSISSKSAKSFLPNFLLTLFSGASPCFILRLPLDVHVDHILIYLAVEDIICLRRTCAAFFLLTHEPVIWKRFLRRINTPIPPLRPTFRYSFRETDYEVEQLVTRSISLDDNWRSPSPAVLHGQGIESQMRVLEMKLLPGGKYLVVSMQDRPGSRYYIAVYSLDHPDGEPRPLARERTDAKAYHLQAKYMVWENKQGIMIAFAQRRFKSGPSFGINPSDYSVKTEIDPPVPFVYDAVCLHISLNALDRLADPRGDLKFLPTLIHDVSERLPPFCEVALLQSSCELNSISLFDHNERPYLALVRHPDQIMIKGLMLGNNDISTLICEPFMLANEMPHTINAIRILPGQKEILVIRTIDLLLPTLQPAPMYLIEIYDSPVYNTTSRSHAKDRYIIDDRHIVDFQISDHGLPPGHDDHPELHPKLKCPPPISIFSRTIEPLGMVHHCIWPRPRRGLPRTYYYDLKYVCPQTIHQSTPDITHILPGAYRALAYNIPIDDRTDSPSLLRLRRYISPETKPMDYPFAHDVEDVPIIRNPRQRWPQKVYSDITMSRELAQMLREGGMTSITWDEGIGRICIAANTPGFTKIWVLDMAQVTYPSSRFASKFS